MFQETINVKVCFNINLQFSGKIHAIGNLEISNRSLKNVKQYRMSNMCNATRAKVRKSKRALNF